MKFRAILVVIALAAAVTVGCQPSGGEEEPEQASQTDTWEPPEPIDAQDRNPLLLVGIDGFKPSYLDTYRNQLPNLTRIAEEGVRAESLKPVFPTHTFPNLYSIATGLYPENHGIISNTIYDPRLDDTMSLGDDAAHANADWFDGEPIWVTAERQQLEAATFFWVGSEAPIGGVRPTHYVPYDSSIRHSDRTDQVVDWLTDDDPVDFATLYFASVDGAGHEYGPGGGDLAETLGRVDNQIGRLIDGLDEEGLWPEINVLFVSDHGMTHLDEDKVVFLDDIIDLSDVWVVDWTPVAMIRPHEGRTDEVYRQLDEANEPISVYRRDELPERFRIRNHHRVPEIVVVADKPYTITSRSYFNDQGMPEGGHGFAPDYETMHGFFLAHGPDLPDAHHTDTLHLVDLYALMTHLLGVEPADHDGSFERIGRDIFGD